MKFYYAAGPGDVCGTFERWLRSEEDEREVAITYSRQFFDLVESLEASAFVVSSCDRQEHISGRNMEVVNRPLPHLARHGRIGYRIGRIISGVRMAWDLFRLRPDVAVINEGTAPWIFVLPAHWLGVQVVPALHCVLWSKGKSLSGLGHRADRYVFRNAIESCLCVSDQIAEQVAEISDDTVACHRFFPTYRPDQFNVEPAKLHEGVAVITYLGRVERDKGVFDLLDAYSLVSKGASAEFELHFCGDGAALNEIIGEAAKRSLDHVTFHGHLSKEEVSMVFERTTMFCVPTRSEFVEGFNKVVAEGLLSGRPVIATTVCPATNEFQDDVFAVEPNSPSALAKAITQVVEKYEAGELPLEKTDFPQLTSEDHSWGAALRKTLNETRQLGYLIPQFPSQTHAFFWRELSAMRDAGAAFRLLSTRPPLGEVCHHEFVSDAVKETIYLNRIQPLTLLYPFAHPMRTFSALRYLAGLKGASGRQRVTLLGVFLCAAQLCRVTRSERIDHVHLHSCADAGHLGALGKILGGPSFSLTLHGDLKVYGLDHDQKFSHASWVSAVTRPLRNQIVENTEMPKHRVPVIWMGVDTSEFTPSPAPASTPDKPLHLATVARLIPQKGHLHALEAIRRVIDAGIQVKYSIAGSGPFEGEIRKKILELNLTEHVEMLGSIGEQEVRALLDAVDVFLLPSYGLGEAAPVSVMEAMACGLPVICSRIGGTTDMIRHKVDGWLVDQRDEEQLVEAITLFGKDLERRKEIGAAARESAMSLFDHRRNAQRLLNCIRRNYTQPIDESVIEDVALSS